MELRINLDDTYMNVIKFGSGDKNLSVIAGVSLTGLEGAGESLEKALSVFSNDFTVYVFDRKKVLPENYSLHQMADDIFRCLKILGIEKTSVYGASHGGMIGQLITIHHPELVENLILCSTMSRAHENNVFNCWSAAAKAHNIISLNTMFLNDVYSDDFRESIKDLIPSFLTNGTSADCERFLILLDSMKDFNITEKLVEIKCPVLVICDKKDKVISYHHSIEISNLLNCKIEVYDRYSHAVYDEAPDLKEKILAFCKG